MKFHFFIAIAVIFLQTQDNLILGRWLMVKNRGKVIDDQIEIFFKKDHSFELFRYEKTKKGNWNINPGKKTLQLFFINDRPEEMKDLLVTQDSLYFSEGKENMVFVRVK